MLNIMDELSKNDNSELIEAFELFDADKDGAISVKELGCVMRALGLTPSEPDLQDTLNKIGISFSFNQIAVMGWFMKPVSL